MLLEVPFRVSLPHMREKIVGVEGVALRGGDDDCRLEKDGEFQEEKLRSWKPCVDIC